MVLRVIGGLVLGGFATYGVVKFVEATGIFGDEDSGHDEVGYDEVEDNSGVSEPLESAGLGDSGAKAVQEAARLVAPLM